MKINTTDETYLPGHMWTRLLMLGLFLFVSGCLFAGSLSYVALRFIQRTSVPLAIANTGSLIAAGMLIGAIQAMTSQSLIGKPTHMTGKRTGVWIVGTIALTLIGIALSIGPFIARADSPIFTWAFNNFGFVLLMIPSALLVGIFQGLLLRNGVRGALIWATLVMVSWLLAAKLCEAIFLYLITF